MRNMNNDFAKSILDNPYNRVEDGQKVTLMEIFSSMTTNEAVRDSSSMTPTLRIME